MNETIEDLLIEMPNFELPASLHEHVMVYRETNGRLSYYFKDGKLACPFHPGFYYVPGYSRYVINLDGVLMNARTGLVRKWQIWRDYPSNSTRRGGYRINAGVSDYGGKRRTISRHRLLCAAFKHPGLPTSHLFVNHINGIPGDDRLENLEYCTSSENVQHAYDNNLHSNKVVGLDILNWKTGETHSFPTIVAGQKWLGYTEHKLAGRLRVANSKKWGDGWRVKRADEKWLEPDQFIDHTSNCVAVVCKNVFTNESFIVGSLSEAAEKTNVKRESIGYQIQHKRMLPINGWMFSDMFGFEGWPKFNEKHLKLFAEEGQLRDGIDVFDRETNENLFFTLREAVAYFKLSPITLSKLARYNGVKDRRYEFKLFHVRCPDNE